MSTVASHVREAELLADRAIAGLIRIKQYLAIHEVTDANGPLSEALAEMSKLDDVVGRDLYRNVQLAERKARRG